MAVLRNILLLACLAAHGLCGTGSGAAPTLPTTSSSSAAIATATGSTSVETGVTSSTTSTATSSEGGTTSTTGPWGIQMSPIGDVANTVWGIEVVEYPGTAQPQLLNVMIGPEPITASEAGTYIIKNAKLAVNTTTQEELFIESSDIQIGLGLDSTFNVSSNSQPNGTVIPLVPFGLNLGRDTFFNGSLVIGGSALEPSYDANRVANGSWSYLSESEVAQGGTFFETGLQYLNSNISIQAYDNTSSARPFYYGRSPASPPTTHQALISFGASGISLPSSLDLCGKTNFTITLNTRSTSANGSEYDTQLVIAFPTTLTGPADRCMSTNNDYVTLGETFFQAVYLMVPDKTGRIYLTAANDYDLPVNPQPFNATAQLIAPASPPVEPSPLNGPISAKAAAIIGSIAAVLFVLTLVFTLVYLMRLHRRRVAESKKAISFLSNNSSVEGSEI